MKGWLLIYLPGQKKWLRAVKYNHFSALLGITICKSCESVHGSGSYRVCFFEHSFTASSRLRRWQFQKGQQDLSSMRLHLFSSVKVWPAEHHRLFHWLHFQPEWRLLGLASTAAEMWLEGLMLTVGLEVGDCDNPLRMLLVGILNQQGT